MPSVANQPQQIVRTLNQNEVAAAPPAHCHPESRPRLLRMGEGSASPLLRFSASPLLRQASTATRRSLSSRIPPRLLRMGEGSAFSFSPASKAIAVWEVFAAEPRSLLTG